MKKFILHWKNSDCQVVYGHDIADAVNKAGIGNGALPALDYWEEVKEEEK